MMSFYVISNIVGDFSLKCDRPMDRQTDRQMDQQVDRASFGDALAHQERIGAAKHDEEERGKIGRPRAICGKRYPLPCFA